MSAARVLRAPTQDRAILADPPLDQVGALVERNQKLLVKSHLLLFGIPLTDLRLAARQEVLHHSRHHLEKLGEPVPAMLNSDGPILMVGHQPEFFHPGVWIKNFALNGLASGLGSLAVNLIADNDTAKSAALQVPTPPTSPHPWPHSQTIPYDQWRGEVPYEELHVVDEALFSGFAAKAGEALQGWNYQPLLNQFWPKVMKHVGRTTLLGERIAAGRRELERSWGCHNLEVPVSEMCQSASFGMFAYHLLSNLERFHALYNECVRAYRRAHGLRSRNHPVPDLIVDGDWREIPFWAWRKGETRRGRLMARIEKGQILVRAGNQEWPSLPVPKDRQLETASPWITREMQGFKVRPRALTNTLFARLFLCDLFIHGIGGAKYDELTDELIRRFYAIEPPEFLALSGTLLLPLPTFPVSPEDERRLVRLRRDLRSNPQRHLSGSNAEVLKLAAQKQEWIAQEPDSPSGNRERFFQLQELTERLRPFVEDDMQAAREEEERVHHQIRANDLLRRRDYAFCLYPEETLRPFCTQFLK